MKENAWRVTLPLSKEGIASGCTLVFLISTGYYAAPVLRGVVSTTVFAETIVGFFHVAGDQWPTGAAFSSTKLISARRSLVFSSSSWAVRAGG